MARQAKKTPQTEVFTTEGWVKFCSTADRTTKYGTKPTYSFVLVDNSDNLNVKDEGEWYNVGFIDPELKVGEWVKFDFTKFVKGDRTYMNVDPDSFSGDASKDLCSPEEEGGSSGGAGKYDSKGAAWGNALQVAARIAEFEYTSGIIEFGKAKKEEKHDLFMAHIAVIRMQLFEDSTPPELEDVVGEEEAVDEEDDL